MPQTPDDEFNVLLEELVRRETTNQLAAYQPYSFQKAWHNAKGLDTDAPAKQKALMCANKIGKCTSFATMIETEFGPQRIGAIFGKSIKILTPIGLRPVRAWVRKPPEECFRLVASDGRWVECPRGHRILTTEGWTSIDRCLQELPSSIVRHPALTTLVSYVRFGLGLGLDFLRSCLIYYRPCGEQLQCAPSNARVYVPSPTGVQKHNARLWHLDAVVRRASGNLFGWLRHRSTLDGVHRFLDRCAVWANAVLSPAYLSFGGGNSAVLQFREEERLPSGVSEVGSRRVEVSSYRPLDLGGDQIVAVYCVGRKHLYDLEIEGGAYCAAGLIHHNTYCGVMEDAYHATGLYPDWWDGILWPHAVNILVAGESADKVRDTLQAELFGDPHNSEAFGTAAVPLDKIVGKPVSKQGYTNAYDSVAIRHVSGGISRIKFQAYEQGYKKFMASGYHIQHADEEPPGDIYSQMIRASIATKGNINLTFTPEDGVTEVVDGFMNELKPGQAFVQADWDDAPHIANDPAHKQQLLDAMKPHEREMRSKGIPQMGSGMIYPVQDDSLTVKTFEIPDWWPRIGAIDFGGFDHPFAAGWMAFDLDTDTAYLYKTYKGMGSLPIHAEAIKRQGDWIPVAWPHDVGQSDKRSGIPMADVLRDEYGLNMLPHVFSNPPSPGQKEGQGGQGVEVGISNVLTAMETGRFKVFETETEWFREKGLYHRKASREGPVRIVKRLDDLMDVTRYAYQSQRFADVRPRLVERRIQMPRGLRNW